MNIDTITKKNTDFLILDTLKFSPFVPKYLIEHHKKYFSDKNLPSPKNEEWQKLNLNRLTQHRFIQGEKLKLNKDVVSMYNISGLYSDIIVFINGWFCPELSRITNLKENLIFGSIKEMRKLYPQIFDEYFNKTNISDKHFFTALNTLYAQDGAFIYIKPNAIIENPIHVYFFTDGEDKKIFSLYRNLIIADKNSQASVLFSYHSLSSDISFTNVVNEIIVRENAYIDFNVFQGEGNESMQISNTAVYQYADSNFISHYYTMCGHLVKNEIDVNLVGDNSNAELNGLYMPDREQQFHNTIFVKHLAKHSFSKQFYRGIIDNNASAFFYGKVLIDKGAIGNEAHQTNNNILLTPYAHAHSKPHLIIYNDDVAASHGSTVGQVDKNALFYMQTRGIGRKKAETLLLSAFAEEVINKIKMIPFKLYIKILTEKRLSGEKIEKQCAKLGICRY